MSPSTAGAVVVGASLAGVHAAVGLRDAGWTGPLTVVGGERHPPYDRPVLSKKLPAGPATAVPAAAAVDASWLYGRTAVGLDPASRVVRLDNGLLLPYTGLVIATGVTANRPPWATPGVHVLRTLDDARAIRAALDTGARRVLVVGAGFIATEIAAAVRTAGAEVTLVGRGPVPLLRTCGALLGEAVAGLHRDHGVRLEWGATVTGVSAGPPFRVALADGRHLSADLVVAATGARPATGWLDGSGLSVRDGVRCDDTCRAAPRIVAAGDVCRWPSRTFRRELRVEHWSNAVEQGEYAGRRLHAELTAAPAPPPYDPVPSLWTEQYGHQAQVLGCPHPADEVTVIAGDPAERRFVAVHSRGGVVRAVAGMNWPARIRRYRDLVAVAALWPGSAPAEQTRRERTWANR